MSSPPRRTPPPLPELSPESLPDSPSMECVQSPTTPFLTPMASPASTSSPISRPSPHSKHNQLRRDDTMIIVEERPRGATATVKTTATAGNTHRTTAGTNPRTTAGITAGAGAGAGDVNHGLMSSSPSIFLSWMKFDLFVRVCVIVLCIVSFSVMVGDKTEGWDGDSFDRYEEFRYLVAVNVIVFAYSLFQVLVKIYRLSTMKFIVSRPNIYYFDLSMDQIFAYLLMSASSAAASRNDVWVSRFGSDDFTNKANSSIIASFLAFFAIAISSIISAYTVFSLA